MTSDEKDREINELREALKMNKLEAWKKFCEVAPGLDATQYPVNQTSHGQAFSAGWDAAVDRYAKIFDSYTKTDARSKVEQIAMWMSVNNYATGHSDTVEDLLKELERQIAEREREACAEIADKCMEDSQRYVATTEREKNCMEAMLVLSEEFAIAIRARGNDNG